LSSSDFFHSFELYKKRYLQLENANENKKALDLFEKWLRGNSNLLQFRVREGKNKKIELGKFFSGIIDRAREILSGKGIQISNLSLGLKESITIQYITGSAAPAQERAPMAGWKCWFLS